MRIINPWRLFALMCLVAGCAGLEGARASAPTASAALPFNCTVGNGDLEFGKINLMSGNKPQPVTTTVSVKCDSAPTPTVFVCIKAQKLPMGNVGGYSLNYDVAAVSTSVSTNGDHFQIQGTISANQQNIPADAYSTTSLVDVAYGSNCATAVKSPQQLALDGTAIVQNACTTTANPLSFGITGNLQGSQPRQAQTTISVRCNWLNVYQVALSGGNVNASDPTQRKMSLNGNPGDPNAITYGLYANPNCNMPWGAQTTVWGHAWSGPPDMTVYGCVPPQPTPTAGNYSDTIVVTVSW
jgi:spore coat protein U-like protein